MKKLMALLLAAIMVFALTACGGDTPASTPAASGASTPAASESTGWVPTKDIEFVIPFGAGGGNDIMVRKMVEIIEKYKLCPVNIVPVNKKGGSGVVGYTYLKDYKAGYEYALASTSASFFTQPITGNSPFSPDTKDFSFVAHLVKDPSVICASKKWDFKTIDDIVVKVVQAQHDKAKKILSEHKDKLHELAKFLYEHETITGEEFMKVLNSPTDPQFQTEN